MRQPNMPEPVMRQPEPSRPPIRRLAATSIAVILAFLLLLSACDSDDTPRPTAVPQPTVPPVITRVVTPEPTLTPGPPPTLSYDIFSVAGDWGLRFQLDINNWSFADQLSYWGFADVVIGPDGAVSGSGYFLATLNDVACSTFVRDNDPLAFTLRGVTRPQGDQVWVDAAILPANPAQVENYEMTCPSTYQDKRTLSQPILWSMLDALGPRQWPTASFDNFQLSFLLERRQVLTFESDLNAETNSTFQGNLSGELRINRN